MFEKTNEILKLLKKQKPLILNITNVVTMDFVANGLLSLGASPVMSYAEQEMEDLLKHAAAVVINPGTVDENFMSLCKHTCNIANKLRVPIILDPVGAGATHYRTEMNLQLIKTFNISLIRGNASEILALAGALQMTKGVDSLIESKDAFESAKLFSKQNKAAIVISGKTDFIIDDDFFISFERGSSLMPSITGTGCLLSAVIAAFHATEKNKFEAAKMAAWFYSICGEIAEKKSQGPGSFKMNFLDALSDFLPSEYHE